MDDRPTIDCYTGVGTVDFVDPGVFLTTEWDNQEACSVPSPGLPAQMEIDDVESVDREYFKLPERIL